MSLDHAVPLMSNSNGCVTASLQFQVQHGRSSYVRCPWLSRQVCPSIHAHLWLMQKHFLLSPILKARFGVEELDQWVKCLSSEDIRLVFSLRDGRRHDECSRFFLRNIFTACLAIHRSRLTLAAHGYLGTLLDLPKTFVPEIYREKDTRKEKCHQQRGTLP